MTTATPTGREYLRVSKDESDQQRSVTEQHADNQRHAQQRGVELAAPYAEQRAVSASRYGSRPRGGFAKLVADLRAGRFGADELWLWEPSRGSRKVSEWAALVEELEAAGVKVYVTSHSRLYDPANPRDRRSLMEDAVDAEYETGKGSQRIRRAKLAEAAAGRPNGRAAYGYRREYDPANRRKFRDVEEPAEAAIVREMFARVAAGDTLRAISRDLTASGVRSRAGKVLTIQIIRPMLTRQTYAGRRVHHPKDGPASVHPATTWPAIVDPVLFDRVQAILSAPERKTRRPGRAVHLLSLIGCCDVCGGWLIAGVRRRPGLAEQWQYRCRERGCVAVPEADLDRLAETLMLGYLARPDVAAQLTAAAASTPDLDAARVDLAGIERELADLYEQVSAGRLSAGALAGIEPGLLARKTAAQARVAELSAPPALAGLITPGRGAGRRWKALAMPAKREVARILLAPDLLGQLRVVRGRQGVRVPVEDRVTFRRAEA